MCDGYFEYPFAEKIEKASDWRKIRPLGKDSEYVRGQIERAKAINDHFIAERACLYNVFVPFTVIRHTLGNDLVMAHVKKDVEAVQEGMKVIAEEYHYSYRRTYERSWLRWPLHSSAGR